MRAVPPEPLGDRPAAWSAAGDVWQRQGPPGTATWFTAAFPLHRGWTWERLWVTFEYLVTIERPRLPEPAYTTDSIPVVAG